MEGGDFVLAREKEPLWHHFKEGTLVSVANTVHVPVEHILALYGRVYFFF